MPSKSITTLIPAIFEKWLCAGGVAVGVATGLGGVCGIVYVVAAAGLLTVELAGQLKRAKSTDKILELLKPLQQQIEASEASNDATTVRGGKNIEPADQQEVSKPSRDDRRITQRTL